VIVRLLKADPTKSNRAVAKLTDTSHPHVAKVRKRAERTGDVETVTTSVDTKGRKQPSKRAKRAKAANPPPPPSNEVLQQRAAAAERIRALMSRPKPARADSGPDSSGEIERIRARNEELERENARLRRENLALRTEIDELKARLPTVSPPADDGLDVPEFLRRSAS
jgi:predicted nuclease with TOPRIM domain